MGRWEDGTKKKENDFRKRFGNTERRRYKGVAGVETVCWILPALSRVLGKERPRKRLKNHDRRETFGVFFTQKKKTTKKNVILIKFTFLCSH